MITLAFNLGFTVDSCKDVKNNYDKAKCCSDDKNIVTFSDTNFLCSEVAFAYQQTKCCANGNSVDTFQIPVMSFANDEQSSMPGGSLYKTLYEHSLTPLEVSSDTGDKPKVVFSNASYFDKPGSSLLIYKVQDSKERYSTKHLVYNHNDKTPGRDPEEYILNSGLKGLTWKHIGLWALNTLVTDETMIPTRGGDWFDGGVLLSKHMHHFAPDDLFIQNVIWNYI